MARDIRGQFPPPPLLLREKPNFTAFSANLGGKGQEVTGTEVEVGPTEEHSWFWFPTLGQSGFVLVSFKLFHMCPKGPSVSMFYKLEK